MPGISDLISGYVGDKSTQTAQSTASSVTNTLKNTEQGIQNITDSTISNVMIASNVQLPECNLINPKTNKHNHWISKDNKKIYYNVFTNPQDLINTGCLCINPLSTTSNSQIFKAVKIDNTNNYICRFDKE